MPTFTKIQKMISALKRGSIKSKIRISSHIEESIQRQHNKAQSHRAKENFMSDLKQGKYSLNIMKIPLYPYQEEGMLHLAFTERALLADEMGLGKTVQAIAACQLLSQLRDIKKVLVIATASLKAEWVEQINKFSTLPSLVIEGSRANRLAQYQCSSFFYLTNYEQILIDGPDIQRLVSPDVIILDEAQRIKNWQTKTANAVKLLKSRYAFVLTGTPLENRIDDIYSVIQFLDPHFFGPLFRFNRQFYRLDEDGKPVGYKNLDELYRKLQPIMLRRRKAEVEGQLPERTINNFFVSMEVEQRIRYEEYEDRVARLLARVRNRMLRKEEFEMLQRWLACMRMICDTPYILDPKCRISPKIRELKNTLEELLTDQSIKIIIFSEWERMLHFVRDLTEKMGIKAAWHTGAVQQYRRRQEINRFKESPDCRIFLSTDAGSLGLNLQVANVVINLDLPWNPAKLEQRIARAWRKHQTRTVQVINFVCENSIEHRMLGLLAQKQTLAQGVLEGSDDLTEMSLPSGRSAFMERMESLMGLSIDNQPTVEATECCTEPGLLKGVEVDVVEPLLASHDEGLVKFSENIKDWVQQAKELAQSNQPKILAVCDSSTKFSAEQLKQTLGSDETTASLLEIIDNHTLEIIKRLAQAGILTLNQNIQIVTSSQALNETIDVIHERKMTLVTEALSFATRKQRMATVLFEQEFFEEMLTPLREALGSALYGFLCLINRTLEFPSRKEILNHSTRQMLVEQHGFSKKSLLLWDCYDDERNQFSRVELKDLYQGNQEIIDEVTLKLNAISLVKQAVI
jgi:hypothetical protein